MEASFCLELSQAHVRRNYAALAPDLPPGPSLLQFVSLDRLRRQIASRFDSWSPLAEAPNTSSRTNRPRGDEFCTWSFASVTRGDPGRRIRAIGQPSRIRGRSRDPRGSSAAILRAG